jgi:hypothetical protein
MGEMCRRWGGGGGVMRVRLYEIRSGRISSRINTVTQRNWSQLVLLDVNSDWQSFYFAFPVILCVLFKLRECIGLMSSVICLHYKRIQHWAALIGFDRPRSTVVTLCIHCSQNLSPLPMLVIAHSARLRTLYCVEYKVARPANSYCV